MKRGEWKKIPGRSLQECTLGVIGVGNAGKAVVRRAHSLGMKVLGRDMVEMPSAFLDETGIEMTSQEEVLNNADYVSINCDLNPSSYHLIDSSQFRLMKSEAVIINTARGPVIKEKDLVQALEEKIIAGAALDVYEDEPLPFGSPLRGMDNVMLAPHNANSSPAAWEKVHETAIRNLLEELKRRVE
jgi:D-3-phosphoglycerate dehydrogenase